MARPATGQVVRREGGGSFSYALRFRAYGRREYVTLGRPEDGWTQQSAERELAAVLRDVDRGVWQPAAPSVGPVDPTFHEFASDWFDAKRHEVRPNTRLDYEWQLTHHLLPFFKDHRLSQITIAEVDRYKAAKLRERPGLAPASINKTITRLSQILEVAVEYGHVDRNAAAGKRRRLKAARPRPVHLDSAEHLAALLEAAQQLDGEKGIQTTGRRAAIALLLLAGPRAGAAGALRWRDVDLAHTRLYIARDKTDAGTRDVDMMPLLVEILSEHKAASQATGADDPVLVTSTGKPRDRHNLRQRVLPAVVRRADELLAERGGQPLPAGLSPHKLRHTFASLLVALGHDPTYVMAQLGHTDPAFTLRVYSHMMRRDPGDRERLRALVEGADWAAIGQQIPQPAAERALQSDLWQRENPA